MDKQQSYEELYTTQYKVDAIVIDDNFLLWKELIEYVKETDDVRNSDDFKKIQKIKDEWKELPKEEVQTINEYATRHITRNVVKYSPPYTFKEIYNFEKENGIKLPQQLKVYLIEISKVIYKKHLEFQIVKLRSSNNLKLKFPWICKSTPCPGLNNSDDEYDKKYYKKICPGIDIDNMDEQTLCRYINDNFDESDYDPSQINKSIKDGYIDPNFNQCGDLFQGSLSLRHIGCGYTKFIVLNGKFKGTVWDEKFCGDGGIYKSYDTFFDYVLEENKSIFSMLMDTY